MVDTGKLSGHGFRKQKCINYVAIANQFALPQDSELDYLSQIRCQESLDSYTCLQSLISGANYYFTVQLKLSYSGSKNCPNVWLFCKD